MCGETVGRYGVKAWIRDDFEDSGAEIGRNATRDGFEEVAGFS